MKNATFTLSLILIGVILILLTHTAQAFDFESSYVPNANGDTTTWWSSGVPNNWDAVNDDPNSHDGDATHIYTNAINRKDMFEVQDLPESFNNSININRIEITGWARSWSWFGSGTGFGYRFGYNDGEDHWTVSTYIVPSTYSESDNYWNQLNMNYSTFNDLQIMVESRYMVAGYFGRITSLYITIDYEFFPVIDNEIPVNRSMHIPIDFGVTTGVDVSMPYWGDIIREECTLEGASDIQVRNNLIGNSFNTTGRYLHSTLSLRLYNNTDISGQKLRVWFSSMNETYMYLPEEDNLSYHEFDLDVVNDPNPQWYNFSLTLDWLQQGSHYCFYIGSTCGANELILSEGLNSSNGFLDGQLVYKTGFWLNLPTYDLNGWRLWGRNESVSVNIYDHDTNTPLYDDTIFQNTTISVKWDEYTESNTTYYWRGEAVSNAYGTKTNHTYHFTTQEYIFYGIIKSGDQNPDIFFDEIPLNNSRVLQNDDGITTSISLSYTEFDQEIRYEHFNMTTGNISVSMNNPLAQTFTCGHNSTNQDFYVTSIRLRMNSAVGEQFYMNITNTNETGVPLQDDVLTSVLYDTTLQNGSYGQWYVITVPVETVYLLDGEMYAIILDPVTFGMISTWSSNTMFNYTGGDAWTFTGGVWSEPADGETDFQFEVYGSFTFNVLNLTFEWYDPLFDLWFPYEVFPSAINGTYSAHNANFSGIDEYRWRVSAITSDLGVTYHEEYRFITFSVGDILLYTVLLMPLSIIGLTSIKKRRKNNG